MATHYTVWSAPLSGAMPRIKRFNSGFSRSHSTMPYSKNCPDNGSACLLVPTLMDKTAELLSGLQCISWQVYMWYGMTLTARLLFYHSNCSERQGSTDNMVAWTCPSASGNQEIGSHNIQGSAKEMFLGCMKRAQRPEETRTRESRNLGTIL